MNLKGPKPLVTMDIQAIKPVVTIGIQAMNFKGPNPCLSLIFGLYLWLPLEFGLLTSKA